MYFFCRICKISHTCQLVSGTREEKEKLQTIRELGGAGSKFPVLPIYILKKMFYGSTDFTIIFSNIGSLSS